MGWLYTVFDTSFCTEFITAGGDGGNTTRTAIIIVVPIAVSLLIAACVSYYLRKRLRKKPEHTIQSNLVFDKLGFPLKFYVSMNLIMVFSLIFIASDYEEDISTEDSLLYDFNQLQAATNNFSDRNKLGEGGFGAVYKVMKWIHEFS